MSGHPRPLEDTTLDGKLAQFVGENGNANFFTSPRWRRKLASQYRRLKLLHGNKSTMETPQETEDAIKLELLKSKQMLERRLNAKPIEHFCYPWFQGCDLSDRLAVDCGYKAVYYGLGAKEYCKAINKLPYSVQRISEEYLFCLPGSGKHSLVRVWSQKFSNFIRKTG